MGDSDENKTQATLVPSWQHAASSTADDSGPQTPAGEDVMEQARRFLQEQQVKNSSKEKKVEFLGSKGLDEADIANLLEESSQTTTTKSTTKTPQTQAPEPGIREIRTAPPESKADQPPIITYPEFLTKPTKPPPLITASGLLNSIGLVVCFSTLVYGATKHLVSPMVDALTEGRIDFHQTANKSLTQLVEKLEQTVSEIPDAYHTAGNKTHAAQEKGADDDDDNSSYDDPTELFHRDVGVQTSPLPRSASSFSSPDPLSSKATPADQTQHQTDRLDRLSVSVRGLATDVIHQAEDLAETKNVLDNFGSDLHSLTYPPESFGMGSSYLYGSQRSEADDEIKKVKMSIRGVKGVLLSTRSFPATTR